MNLNDQTYKIKGGRVGILLLHGLGGTPTQMRYLAHGLAREGYTVHCPMLAGHGGSAELLASATFEDWYASASDALDELQKDCDTVLVGGLSVGAIIALLLSARRPNDITALKLFAPTLWLNGWGIPWYARLFRLLTVKSLARLAWFPNLAPHGIKCPRVRQMVTTALASEDGTAAGLANTPGAAVYEHGRLVAAVKRELANITQPVLILHPREDDYADLSNALYLNRSLPGAVEMVVLEDCYHFVTVDRQRQSVVDHALAFASAIVGGAFARGGVRAEDLGRVAPVGGGAPQGIRALKAA